MYHLKSTQPMKKNVGSIDKIVRIVLAIVLASLFFTGLVEGTTGIILLVVAAVLLLTSAFSLCPLYLILGLNTCKVKSH